MDAYFRAGRGRVPSRPLLSAAWKAAWEVPAELSLGASAAGLGRQLDFTTEGVSFDDFRGFFRQALEAAQRVEPIVEAGNKYGVAEEFTTLNGELLLHEIRQSPVYCALLPADRERADAFFRYVCLNGKLRNRNPLHPVRA